MKILVTGGAGFIGSHTCEHLLKLGYEVIAVDDFNDFYDPKIKEKNTLHLKQNPHFKLYREDITNLKAMRDILSKEKPTIIIHLAARAGVLPSLKNPALYQKVNVEGTRNLLELAREFNIQRFIFGSSSSVYGLNKEIPFREDDVIDNIASPYAETKKEGEMLCLRCHQKYGIHMVCLRFFTVYGPRGRPDMAPYKFTKSIMEGEYIDKYGDGSSKRDYTYISDIVEGIIKSIRLEGFNIINLGNQAPISLNEFIALIERITGKKAKIKQLPMQKGDVPITYANISRAKKLLNWQPKVGIEQGMKLLYSYLKH